MSSILKDRVAIITGAGRGLGKAFALRFAEEGAKLLLPDIAIERTETVAKEINSNGGQAIPVQTDISSEVSVKMMAEKVIQVYGQVDILVNNAAIYYGLANRPWTAWTLEEWDRIFHVNVRGTWLCCKAIAPLMIKQNRGKIINISSAIMKSPAGAAQLPYACSKAAVKTMTELLARSLGTSGINVNAIAPGYTDTEASSTLGNAEKAFEMASDARSIHRREVPEDLVGTAVFLASKDSDFVTGQLLVVDGGTWMV